MKIGLFAVVEMQQRKETSQELREAPSDAADVSPTVSSPKGTTDAAELTVSVRDEALHVWCGERVRQKGYTAV